MLAKHNQYSCHSSNVNSDNFLCMLGTSGYMHVFPDSTVPFTHEVQLFCVIEQWTINKQKLTMLWLYFHNTIWANIVTLGIICIHKWISWCCTYQTEQKSNSCWIIGIVILCCCSNTIVCPVKTKSSFIGAQKSKVYTKLGAVVICHITPIPEDISVRYYSEMSTQWRALLMINTPLCLKLSVSQMMFYLAWKK